MEKAGGTTVEGDWDASVYRLTAEQSDRLTAEQSDRLTAEHCVLFS